MEEEEEDDDDEEERRGRLAVCGHPGGVGRRCDAAFVRKQRKGAPPGSAHQTRGRGEGGEGRSTDTGGGNFTERERDGGGLTALRSKASMTA